MIFYFIKNILLIVLYDCKIIKRPSPQCAGADACAGACTGAGADAGVGAGAKDLIV